MLDAHRIQALKVAAYERCGNRSVFHHRHDVYLRKYIALLGYEFILSELQTCDYTHLDYFYSEKRGVIGRWDDIDKRRQESRLAAEKAAVLKEARLTREVESPTWTAYASYALLCDEYGERHPKSVEFARKWGL